MKRYTLEVDFYIFAESDKDAIKQAKEWKANMEKIHDNQPKILKLHETPFASFIARQIDLE